jgi:hypothetical protein
MICKNKIEPAINKPEREVQACFHHPCAMNEAKSVWPLCCKKSQSLNIESVGDLIQKQNLSSANSKW